MSSSAPAFFVAVLVSVPLTAGCASEIDAGDEVDSAEEEESEPAESMTQDLRRTAPSCVTSRSFGNGYIQVINRCDTAKRVRVDVRLGNDIDCVRLAPLRSDRSNFYDAIADVETWSWASVREIYLCSGSPRFDAVQGVT